MLPRLQAEEQLDAVRAGALSAGAYKEDTQREMLDRLHKAASGGVRQRGRKVKPAELAAMGIAMVVHDAPAEERPSQPSDEGMNHV